MAEPRRLEGINATGDDRPSLKDLHNHVVQGVASKWRDLGVQLLDPDSENMLVIIERNHPQDVIECCKCVLRKWLDTKSDASWNQLLEALRSPSLQLNYLSDEIEHKFKEKSASSSEDNKHVVGKLTSLNKIEVEFAKMTTKIKQALQKYNITVALLIEQLCAVSAVNSKKVPILDEDTFEKIKSIDELWRKLRNFWNIFDYDLLILVIDLCECSEAQEILDSFLAKIDLSALEDIGLVLHYKIYEEKLTLPILRIKVNAEKCTLDVKKKVKQIMSKNFDLQEYALYLRGIKEGCFQFIYHLSEELMSYLLEFKVTSSIMADFARHNIISLQIDNMILNVQHKIANVDEVFVWLMQPNLDVDSGSTIHSTLVYLCDKLVPLVSTKWYDLGLMLLDPVQLRLLQETEEQNKQFAFPYCQMMLSKWLHMFNAATWYQLIKAARSIKLKDIADSIEFLLLQGVVGSKGVMTSCRARSPTIKELDKYVVPLIGTKWYHIGLVLLDAKHALDHLEKQYKHYTQHYCQLLFSTWLCTSDNATWYHLMEAIRSIKLKDASYYIESMYMYL